MWEIGIKEFISFMRLYVCLFSYDKIMFVLVVM